MGETECALGVETVCDYCWSIYLYAEARANTCMQAYRQSMCGVSRSAVIYKHISGAKHGHGCVAEVADIMEPLWSVFQAVPIVGLQGAHLTQACPHLASVVYLCCNHVCLCPQWCMMHKTLPCVSWESFPTEAHKALPKRTEAQGREGIGQES